MSRSKGIYARLRMIGEEFERRWGHPVVILHSQGCRYEDGFCGKVYDMFIYLPVTHLKPGWKEEIERWFAEKRLLFMRDDLAQLNIRRLNRKVHPHLRNLFHDPENEVRTNPMAPCLWASVVYGEEHMERIRKHICRRLGDDIIERLKAEMRRYKRFLRYCDKPLGPREHKQLREMLKKRIDSPRDVIVGVDASGRPLAQAISWFYASLGRKHEVYYLDPHQILADLIKPGADVPRILAEYADTLRQEIPGLYAALVAYPDRVLVVDDQFRTQSNMKLIFALFQEVTGVERTGAAMTFLSDKYSAMNPPPSWHKRRDVVGVELAESGSLTALSIPTKESKQFYRQLKVFVEEYARKCK